MIQINAITAAQTWPIRHQVLWPEQDLAFVQLPEDENGRHFGVYVGPQLTSIISLFEQGTSVQFRKFATLEQEQGKGYGSQLLRYVMEKELPSSCQVFWCNARVSQQGFYERFGLLPTQHTYVKEGIDFVVMEKVF